MSRRPTCSECSPACPHERPSNRQEEDRGLLDGGGLRARVRLLPHRRAKNWTIDGFPFFLVDKLLRDGGWILFDDFDWTYAATRRCATDGVNHQELGEDELTTPHIERVDGP
jgi:hypothetical protein